MPAGFNIESFGTSNRWTRIACEKCPKWTIFVNCTPDRVAWFAKTHRHGLPHTEWHTDEPAPVGRHDDKTLTNVMNALCVATQTMLHTPRTVFHDPGVYTAGEALAAQLETALAFAHQSAKP